MRFAFFLLSCTALAAQPDYFPLQPGNQWTYRASRFGTPFTVEVAPADSAGPAGYSLVRGFPEGDVWLRMADDGTLYRYDPQSRAESVWAEFGAPAGQTYSTSIDRCNQTAVIRSKAVKAEVPIGRFENALSISYPPSNCADAGLTSEMYLPYVGLLQRTATSFAGPVVYDLVYARLNDGLTIVTAPEQSVAVSLDGQAYRPGTTATVRLTVRNTLPQPLEITFPSGQRYDVRVTNEKGETVYLWSRDKIFIAALGSIRLEGEKTWVIPIPVPDAPGRYTVEAWVSSRPATFAGTAAMEVRP